MSATDEDDEEQTFWGEIRARMIIGTPMDGDIRITFMCGALTLVVAMIVNVLHDHLGPPIAESLGTIPLGALVVFIIGQFAVLALCFKGVLLLQRNTRLTVLIAFALGIAVSSATLKLTFVAAVLALPPLALAAFAARKTRATADAAWWPALAGAAGMTIAFVVAARTGNDMQLFRLAAFAVVIAAIGLFMASMDFAEIAQIGSDAVADRFIFNAGLRGTVLIAGAVLVSACVCFVAGAIAIRIPATFTAVPGTFLGAGFSTGQFLTAALSMTVDLAVVLWIAVSVGRGPGNLWVKPHFPYPVVAAVVTLCTLLFAGAALFWFTHEAPATNPFKANAFVVAQMTLLIVAIAGFLTAGRRSATAYLAFGFGAVVAVLCIFQWSGDALGFVQLPFNVSLGTLAVLAIALVWPKTRDRFPIIGRMLISLNLAIAAYALIAAAFLSVPLRLHDGSIVQACIVLAALAWDVLTSAGITRPHSERLPHNARTSFFIAYISLVALFVMMSSAMTMRSPIEPGASIEGVFDSEFFVYIGLLLFGGPMLIFLFFVRMRAVLQSNGRQASSGAHD